MFSQHVSWSLLASTIISGKLMPFLILTLYLTCSLHPPCSPNWKFLGSSVYPYWFKISWYAFAWIFQHSLETRPTGLFNLKIQALLSLGNFLANSPFSSLLFIVYIDPSRKIHLFYFSHLYSIFSSYLVVDFLSSIF